MQRGIATFTLDYGVCPKWLFERMVKLGREMVDILVMEYGPDEFIKRIADPVWFQSLGTVLAFDWNASGLTTILTAALKEAIRGRERDLGVFICGGKGKTSLKTPDEITSWAGRLSLPNPQAKSLVYNSRMSAKVDSSLIQDGFQLYHHAFFFSRNGAWTVVQQGMNKEKRTARRYHWFSENAVDLIREPHTGIISQNIGGKVLNMTAKESDSNRNLSLDLVSGNYNNLMKDIRILREHSSSLSKMVSVVNGVSLTRNGLSDGASNTSCPCVGDQLTLLELEDTEFYTHPVVGENFSRSKYLEKILWKLCDEKPRSYEQVVATKGVGPKTIRALSLVSEVIYGAEASYKDPARYSFAHGGKDATPYPVDRKTYDESIGILKKAVCKMKLSLFEKNKIVNRLDCSDDQKD